MTKTRFLLGVIALTVMASSIFYACKKDNSSSALENNVALKKELIALNNEIYSQIDKISVIENTQKLSWRDVGHAVGKFCAIAGSDICGAGAGAVAGAKLAAVAGLATGGTGAIVVEAGSMAICAAGASYATGKSVCSSLPPNSNPNVDGWDYLNSGNLHNQLLKELYERFDDTEFDNSVLIKLAMPKFNISAEQASIFYSEEWNDVMEQVKEISREYAHNDDNSIQLLNRYHERGLIEENIYEVLHSFLEIYSNITEMEQIHIIVSSYAQFVRTSTWLSSTERTILLSTLAVASKSPFFWIQFEDETNPADY